MASVTSLGVHTPTALPYLINEGILPPDPKQDQYQWNTYVWTGEDDDDDDLEEELLTTRDTVVWSQGKFIRNVLRFHQEGEDVAHALMTRFPAPSTATAKHDAVDVRLDSSNARVNNRNVPNARALVDQTAYHRKATAPLAKAIVVILKSKMHIFFCKGPSYVLDLPFEVDCALPAVQGLLLQRKRKSVQHESPPPQIPRAPVNSFFSSQTLSASSYMQSPSLDKSFAKTRHPSRASLHGDTRLDALFRDIVNSGDRSGDEATAGLYSLTDPLADLGVVTCALQHDRLRSSGKARSGMKMDFEAIDPAEEILYVSTNSEMASSNPVGSERLVLLVTMNRELRIVTVWHAWYLGEKSLKTLLQMRAENKAAKARRRSSFLNTNAATGVATPAVRHRDAARESFAAPGTLRLPVEPSTSQQHTISSRKRTQEEEAEAMASQMDPDYQPSGSQQPARENRRISSINTDLRTAHGTVNPSFTGANPRRHTSFGAPGERRSLGNRQGRTSFPGSVFAQSVGTEDDEMAVDTIHDNDHNETIETTVRHIRSTYEACEIDSVFGSMEQGFKRELVVRKLHSFPLSIAFPSQISFDKISSLFKLVTLSGSQPPRMADRDLLNIYLHLQGGSVLRCLTLHVFTRPLWSDMENSPLVPIPIFVSDEKLGNGANIAKLRDSKLEAMLLSGQGLVFPFNHANPCPLPPPQPYRVYDALDVLLHPDILDKDIGKNRTIQPTGEIKEISLVGSRGAFDEIMSDGTHHRRRLQLRPRESEVELLIEVLQIVLPPAQARMVRRYWCMAYSRLAEHPGKLNATASNSETAAMMSTIFLFIIELLDPKAKAALKIFRLASSSTQTELSRADLLRKQEHERQYSSSPALSWIKKSGKPDEISSPKDNILLASAALADEIHESEASQGQVHSADLAASIALKLMLSLHIVREEQKLCSLSTSNGQLRVLAPMIAQLGAILGLPWWTYAHDKYYGLEGADEDQWVYIKTADLRTPRVDFAQEPLGVLQWFEQTLARRFANDYPTLAVIAQLHTDDNLLDTYIQFADKKTPRIVLLRGLLQATDSLTAKSTDIVEHMAALGMTQDLLDTFPVSIAAPFKEAIARCEKNPPATWSQDLLQLVGRDDLVLSQTLNMKPSGYQTSVQSGPRDIFTICQALDQPSQTLKTKEASRNSISVLIFDKDRRLVEATSLMHFNNTQVAECPKQPEWTEAQHFDQQRRMMYFVTTRMIALPAGDGMLHYDSQTPFLTERHHLPGFSSTVLVQPMGHTLTIDRSGLTEEKLNWAYFHAGVSSGLRIARSVKGIDTSWIAFNKPGELTNRHAGLLLALGLNGHLRNVAKWLSFKYLTPKHNMTSIGLLLGLSASYLGTMDGLVARMLSVHITRMLPPGAAELNVSPITQTAGLMGVGLLYYNSQHRRMSEVMLSEIEHMEVEDPDSEPDPLRDESYRLAAGFALGLINIGRGDDLRGLHGMQLSERLLTVAVGPRPVHAVHVLDRATAGSVMAIAFIYMKSGNRAVARKIDIPDTEAQYDQIRPDVLLLRAMTKHIIMWDDIKARKTGPNMQGWIDDNLPKCYKGRWRQIIEQQASKTSIDSAQVPLFNVYTGLAWALALKYAGSGNLDARDDILQLLDLFHAASEAADAYYYDGKLGRSALRRCIDVLALAAATVMAGTGDITTFRYLRRMHGRVDSDTSYGSHLAGHMAVGALFMGGGTFTFGTTNLAVASLICAFYPLFPTDVHDNRCHLQAFRHFWVLAAEARCIVLEDIDIRRPIHMDIIVTLRSGEVQRLRAPCLLPVLESISTIQTNDPAFWQVTLDFARNDSQLASFRRNQRVYVRRCPAAEAHKSTFSASLAALDTTLSATQTQDQQQLWRSLFQLPAFQDLDQADIEMMLPPDLHSSAYLDERSTSIDDSMVLAKAAESGDRDALWNLKILFAWADRAEEQGEGELKWLRREVIERLKAKVEARIQNISEIADP